MPKRVLVVVLGFGLAVLAAFFPSSAEAQVVINEINPTDEWVELYNTSDNQILLQECVLTMGSPTQDVNYGEADKIEGKSFKIVEKDIDVEWTGNWLNNDGDSAELSCPEGAGSDSVTYSDDVDELTYGRAPDGTGGFTVLASATKGTVNSGPKPTPTPSPTATPTPSPTPTPTKTPTPTPTKTATPKPTPKPSVLADATTDPRDSPASSPSTSQSSTASVESQSESEESAKPKPGVLPMVFIGGGVLLLGGAGFTFYRVRKNDYTLRSENKESS